MKIMQQCLLALITFCLSIFATIAQTTLNGKFIDYRLSTSNYIIFNTDNTFTFSYAIGLQRDISCGNFELKNDTILFHYKSGIIDTACNTQKINLLSIDGRNSYQLIGSLGDTLSRPAKLYLHNNKLYSISQNGKVIFSIINNDDDNKPNKSERKYYRRKYLLFGHFVRKSNDAWHFKKEV